MQNNYLIASEIRREVEQVQEMYRAGRGPNGRPIDKTNERYAIEDVIVHHINQAFGRAGWTRGK